jgi:glycosyltransferase 2 family protein
MSSTHRRLLAGGILALGLLGLFFRGVDWTALRAAFRSADPWFLAGVVVATLVTYVARAWRWGYLLAPLARVPFLRLFSVTLVGFMSGLIVPRAGEVVRPYLVARHHALKTSAAFASIILERLVDLITVLALFFLYLYVLPHPAAQAKGPLMGALRLGGALAAVGVAAILALLFALHARADRVMALIDRVLFRLPARLAAPASRALRSFASGLAVLQASPSHLLAILGQSLVVWLAIATSFYCCNRAFGLDLPFSSTFLLLAFLTVGVAVPTPGNVGGFHEAYLLALTQVFGVSRDTAAAAGIAGHALGNLPVLVLGLVFLGREGLTMGKVAKLTDKPPDPPHSSGTSAYVAVTLAAEASSR